MKTKFEKITEILNQSRYNHHLIYKRKEIKLPMLEKSLVVESLPIASIVDIKAERKKAKKAYRLLIRKLTKEVDKRLIPGYVPELVYNPFLHGSKAIYSDFLLVIDHKISIASGWRKGISPELIARPENLQFISCRENMEKGQRCLIDQFNRWIWETGTK